MTFMMQTKARIKADGDYHVTIATELHESATPPFVFNPVAISEFTFKCDSFAHAKAIVHAVNQTKDAD